MQTYHIFFIIVLYPYFTQVAFNALLSSEARNTNASALLRKHKTNRKPKMPRVPNLLEQFVMLINFYLSPNLRSIGFHTVSS
ncbi:hypothetical protein CGH05_21000 [Vibrio parahaemolyticus]|nr:hypothetical protein CGH05_21000 [Vibrio parahaemolyticus]